MWFPRLGADRLTRRDASLCDVPVAVIDDRKGMQVLWSLSASAQAAGLVAGQPLRDAHAMCDALVTRPRHAQAEAAFLSALRRWSGRFSPWVGEEPPQGLIADITGCAHLFGGEEALMARIAAECGDMGVCVRTGIADTVGAAWALARYAGVAGAGVSLGGRSGDAIDQEAFATRSRAARRPAWRMERPGVGAKGVAAPVGRMRAALAPLPVAALRLPADVVEDLARLGLRRIDDIWGQPRAGLARRFGRLLVQRLDQAMGVAPEPVSPARADDRFAVRLTLPEPIGLEADIAAALDRLLPRLEQLLTARGKGARRVRLECHRADHGVESVEIGLARPSAAPDRIRPLLMMKVPAIDAGFGIDRVRLIATLSEPVQPSQHRGHAEAESDTHARLSGVTALDDLIGRIGARIGLDTITRQHPADSHVPEKAANILAAAWSEPAPAWPARAVPRPLTLWRPEPVTPDPAAGCTEAPGCVGPECVGRERVGRERLGPEPSDAGPVSHAPGSADAGLADRRTADRAPGNDAAQRAVARYAHTGSVGPQSPGHAGPPARFRWRGRTHCMVQADGPERIAPEWWLDDPLWRSGVRDYWSVTTDGGERLWLYFAHGATMTGGWFAHGRFA